MQNLLLLFFYGEVTMVVGFFLEKKQ